MKRLISVLTLVLSVLLLLSACGGEPAEAEPVQPVLFYYRTAQTDYTAEDGVIRAELRDLGTGTYTDRSLFDLYFAGPLSPDFVSPISQDTKLSNVERQGGILTLYLTRSANSPAEFDHTLSYACLCKTGLALDGINKVRIVVSTVGGSRKDTVILTDDDFLLYDYGTVSSKKDVTLYFADGDGTLLLTEKQSFSQELQEDLALELVKGLTGRPQSEGMRSPLPLGSAVTSAGVEENGLCTVDLNSDFLSNLPEDEQTQELAILSVVNTLCELDNIDQVRFYVAGSPIGQYGFLDLSAPWMMDSSVVGPIREEYGEFAGTLCLPGRGDGLLRRITVRARARGGASREEALLSALFARTTQNGLYVPFSGASAPLSVSTVSGICSVDLAPNSLPESGEDRELAIRSIAATLTTLPGVRVVKLSEAGEPVSSEPLKAEESWFRAGQPGG